ncbi:unnamed protein product [Orchesella dallaii]|uniref:Uncharacterized protein n=1 Tax=Orchesella dallaii TaxID=48710 RepID=A0ABP1S784_9HEXA
MVNYQLQTLSETEGDSVLPKKSELMPCNKNPYSFMSRFRLFDSSLYATFDLGRVVLELAIAIAPLIIRNVTFVSILFPQICKDIKVIKSYDMVFGAVIYLNVIPFDEFKFANVPLQMNNPMRSFKFLSCGKPPQKSVGFIEFVNIFQWDVWLIIIIFILIIFPVVFHGFEVLHNKVVRAKSNIYEKFSFNLFMEPLVVLLEEGEAFTANNLQLGSLRWMLACLLIAGKVLEKISRRTEMYCLASKSLLEKQRKLLFDAIKICNRTAIIVPELFAIGMAERLKKVSGFKYVFVGIKTLFRNKIAFEFSGWIPNRIWGRVEALRTSGIWEWWSNVVTTGTGQFAFAGRYRDSELVVEKPTINGNSHGLKTLTVFVTVLYVSTWLAWFWFPTAGIPTRFEKLDIDIKQSGIRQLNVTEAGAFLPPKPIEGVNLLPLNSPIILWEPKLALVISAGSKYFVLIPKQMGSMVNQSDYSSACSSFLLSDRDVIPCLALKYEIFMMKSRLLKCQVNIALYPQEYMLVQPKAFRLYEDMATLLKFPIGFHHNLLTYHSRVRPSTQVLNVLITNSADAIKKNKEKFFVWIYSLAKHLLNSYIQLSVSEDLFLYVRTKHANIYNSIVSLSVLTVDLHTINVSKASITLHKLHPGFLNLPIETVLSEVSSYYKHNLVYYQLVTSSQNKGSNVLTKKSEPMACNKNPYSFISRFWLEESNLYDNFDLGEVIEELVIAITPSIIRNVTFIGSRVFKQTCKDIRITMEYDRVFHSLIDLNVIPYDEFKFANVPLQMNNPMQSFKFLSCGKPPQNSVGFIEFVNIFQWNVWLIIIILILLIFPVVFHSVEVLHNKVVRAKSNIYTKFSFNLFLEPLVVLLEEGEAFTANNLQLDSLRWMLASLLIAVAGFLIEFGVELKPSERQGFGSGGVMRLQLGLDN